MSENFHPVVTNQFVKIILPIAIPKAYTYYIPTELQGKIKKGVRVEVQFGKNRVYAGLVLEMASEAEKDTKPKPIISVIDDEPIVNEKQLQLWQWIAEYYACTIGEVMNAALPANLKLASETRILLSPVFDNNFDGLDDKEYMIAEALSIQNELSIEDVRKILEQKTVYPLINRLLEKRIVYVKEEIKTKYKPKKITCVRFAEPYASDSNTLQAAFDQCTRSTRQVEAIMAYIQLARNQEFVRKQEIYKAANVDSSVINALVKKKIFETYDKEVSRIDSYKDELSEAHELTEQQTKAIASIDTQFQEKNVVLLHGVTGSGKTRVYTELIQKTIKEGGQVLYLLPEIALTTQIINRLKVIFGDAISVYHSRLNNNERVDLWKAVLAEKSVVLGARSSLFLPYKNLQLIIIDEEHDASYKQYDPAPRYNARDAAIYYAHLTGAKVLLGTATPSLESYQNARSNKYGLVEMKERFGGMQLPEIVVVDKREELKKQTMQSHFTSVLIAELKQALENGEQVILFQNRRGYSPTMQCPDCGWHSECRNCDVSMTYHKYYGNLQCHYCGSQQNIPKECPACGSRSLNLKGYGTEKIEDELKLIFPDAQIGRMDFDTVKTKHAHARIINDFEEKRIDILVGTQMVTKGLDFDNVSIVGILSADQQLQFPDFRAGERSFQLFTQVSGRAGRKKKRGKVILQAFDVNHAVIKEVIENAYTNFFNREIFERKTFGYPPYSRLIKITLKHKKPASLNKGTQVLSDFLKAKLGSRVIGPAVPYVSRVRTYYLMDIMLKLERKVNVISHTKKLIQEATYLMQKTPDCSQVRVSVNVDPY